MTCNGFISLRNWSFKNIIFVLFYFLIIIIIFKFSPKDMFIDFGKRGRDRQRERERERERERSEREILIGCLLYTPQPGIEPPT